MARQMMDAEFNEKMKTLRLVVARTAANPLLTMGLCEQIVFHGAYKLSQFRFDVGELETSDHTAQFIEQVKPFLMDSQEDES